MPIPIFRPQCFEPFYWQFVPEDLPMNKVKFTANTEYEYLHNFKILQSA